MYKLAGSVIITMLLSNACTASPNEAPSTSLIKETDECKDMAGTYSVIPFTRPLGLKEVANRHGLHANGELVFQVGNEEGSLKHIGLVSGIRFDIKLQNKTDENLVDIDDSFGTSVIKCNYKLDDDTYVIKVDLQAVEEKNLVAMANHIPKTWRYAILDYGSEKAYENPHVSKKIYRLDSKSLRSVHYFLTHRVPYSYVVMIPLQKKSM